MCFTPNAERLFATLQEFWGGPVPAVSAPAELAVEGMVFQFGRPPNRIDLLSNVSGIQFEQAWDARLEARLVGGNEDIPLPFVGLSDLVASKRAAGRPKDLEDLRYLEALLNR